jgi:hypothetical protein
MAMVYLSQRVTSREKKHKMGRKVQLLISKYALDCERCVMEGYYATKWNADAQSTVHHHGNATNSFMQKKQSQQAINS